MRKVLFRADASPDIGYGHFIRSLALADMLKNDFECTFFTQTPTEYQRKEVTSVCKLQEMPSSKEKFTKFLSYLDGTEIVVLDNYFFTTSYQQKIKNKGCKLVCIDDMHDKHYIADIVINHGLNNPGLFDIEPYTQLCLGHEWALLRHPFLQENTIPKEKDHWFISFGGSDWLNLTGKFITLLSQRTNVSKITAVVGDGFKFLSTLPTSSKIEIKKNLSAEEVSKEMMKAEYAVLPASTVCIEALTRKCKVFCGYFVDNQKEIYESLNKQKMIYPIEDLLMYSGKLELPNFDVSADPVFIKEIKQKYITLFNDLN